MKELFGTSLALFTLFGGLGVWPWMRKTLPVGDLRVKSLKVVFWSHLVLVGAGFSVVYYSYLTSPDWLHSLLLPYLIGIVSLAASLLVLVFGKKYNV